MTTSLKTLIISKNNKIISDSESIILDAVLEETHKNTVRLTNNPVEKGADISDHAIIEPTEITVTIITTNTPMNDVSQYEIVDKNDKLGTSTENNLTRNKVAYEKLLTLLEERQLLEIQTDLKLYSNMIFVGLPVVTNVKTKNILKSKLNFKEVIITDSKIRKLTYREIKDIKAKHQASEKEDRGIVKKEQITEREKTIAKKVLRFIKND